MWYSSWTLSLLINWPYYVLQTCYIMFFKLYYWNYSGYWGPQYFPPGGNPIEINKYHIISYHIISYLKMRRNFMWYFWLWMISSLIFWGAEKVTKHPVLQVMVHNNCLNEQLLSVTKSIIRQSKIYILLLTTDFEFDLGNGLRWVNRSFLDFRPLTDILQLEIR